MFDRTKIIEITKKKLVFDNLYRGSQIDFHSMKKELFYFLLDLYIHSKQEFEDIFYNHNIYFSIYSDAEIKENPLHVQYEIDIGQRKINLFINTYTITRLIESIKDNQFIFNGNLVNNPLIIFLMYFEYILTYIYLYIDGREFNKYTKDNLTHINYFKSYKFNQQFYKMFDQIVDFSVYDSFNSTEREQKKEIDLTFYVNFAKKN
jgi:hypothetical protein